MLGLVVKAKVKGGVVDVDEVVVVLDGVDEVVAVELELDCVVVVEGVVVDDDVVVVLDIETMVLDVVEAVVLDGVELMVLDGAVVLLVFEGDVPTARYTPIPATTITTTSATANVVLAKAERSFIGSTIAVCFRL